MSLFDAFCSLDLAVQSKLSQVCGASMSGRAFSSARTSGTSSSTPSSWSKMPRCRSTWTRWGISPWAKPSVTRMRIGILETKLETRTEKVTVWHSFGIGRRSAHPGNCWSIRFVRSMCRSKPLKPWCAQPSLLSWLEVPWYHCVP